MRKLAANHLIDRACGKIPRLFDSSPRLRDNAGLKLLPAPHHPNDRHLSSPNAIAAQRQRSALEALIANVAPADAALMASALIDEFSSLGRVFAETREAIERVVGPHSDIPSLLQAAHRACVTSLSHEIRLRSIHSTDQKLIDYLVTSMGSDPVERLRVLFLDLANHLIGDEIVASGTISTVTVYPRNIFKRALELSASSMVLVHNHPAGSMEPSQSDIDFTRKIARSANLLEIALNDHIVIAGPQWFSFARRGLI
jgi:DNA repair protein RadC